MSKRPKVQVTVPLLCLVCLHVVSAEIPQAVSFWRFEGHCGDSGAGGNNGTLVGSAAIVSDIVRGKCLELDGHGYVDIRASVTELGAGDFTIAAWIKTTEIGIPILSKCNGDKEWQESEKELYVANAGLSEYDNDGTVEYVGHSCDWIRGRTQVNDGRWRHIAVTWNAEVEEGGVYVDSAKSTDVVGFTGGSDNEDDTVRIGFSAGGHTDGDFVGRIDDLAIFDVALSAEQISELMRFTSLVARRAGGAPRAGRDKVVTLDTDPALLGWWKFDEASGKTAADSSKHRRKGVLKGALSFDKGSVPGRVDRALKFNAGEEHVEITDYKGVTGTKPRTVAAWIKTSDDRGRIISWGADDFGQMWNFGFIRGRVGVSPNGGYLYMNEGVDDNEWRHVAAVVREAELPNLHDDVVLYLDGDVAEIHDIGLLDLWPIQTGSDLNVMIGKGFKGLIDDVRVYGRDLSGDEIKALFKLQSNRPLSKPRP